MKSYFLIVGPDGSGKSTFAQSLIKTLDEKGIRYKHYHFLSQVSKESNKNSIFPHALPMRPFFLSLFSIFARYFRALAVFFRMISFKGCLIQERGWWDQIVDPKRYRLHPNSILFVRIFGFFLPRPNFVFILTGDSQTIARRKTELSPQETERQCQKWLVQKGVGPKVVIDTTDEQDKSIFIQFAVMTDIQKFHEMHLYSPLLLPKNYECIASKRTFFRCMKFFSHKKILSKSVLFICFFLANCGLVKPVKYAPYYDGLSFVGFGANVGKKICGIKSSFKFRWIFNIYDVDESLSIKIGLDDEPSLRNEFYFLQMLSGYTKWFSVPKPVSLHNIGYWNILITQRIEVDFLQRRLTKSEIDLIFSELKDFDGFGVTHGDFTKWNVVRSGNGIAILDWEAASIPYQLNIDRERYFATLHW